MVALLTTQGPFNLLPASNDAGAVQAQWGHGHGGGRGGFHGGGFGGGGGF